MLFVLSPAKALDYEHSSPATLPHTLPIFSKQTQALIKILKKKSDQEISMLMRLSPALAELNVARYKAWSTEYTHKNSKQALLAFNGDVYDGLEAKTLTKQQLVWAQDHVAILSGLYGVLRPLDWMQAYRLEMGTPLETARGKNLYQFWNTSIAHRLNAQIAVDQSPIIVNLASQEYFKAVDRKALQARTIDCVFEDEKEGHYKIISFFAKRARGLMARYAILNKVQTVEKLKAFQLGGYKFVSSASETNRLVFRRKQTV